MKLSLTTESLARSAGHHPWITIGIWAVSLIVASILVITLLGDALTTDETINNNPESKQADKLLEERLGRQESTIDEMVIVRSTTFTVDDPAYQSHVEGLFGDFMALGDEVVVGGVHYYLTGDESLVSANRNATIMPLVLANAEEVERVHEVVDKAGEGDAFDVLISGNATMEEELIELAEKDMMTGEVIGISVALVVLALVFGAIVASIIPIVLALAAVLVALGATALIGQAFDLIFFVTNMITMMGLAVGIDYSLFIVSRYREERARGLEKNEAIAKAGNTASRAVLFSGMTVVLALCSLLIFPMSIFQSMGVGAILVVIVTILASLTLLPAILSLLGDKVNAIRIPLIQRRKAGMDTKLSGGFWNWIAYTVMRRPVISLIVALALLVTAIVPYLDLNKGFSGVSALPDDFRSKEAFLVLQQEFGFGQDAPANIVIDGQTDLAAVEMGIEQLRADLAADTVFGASGVIVHPEANLSILSVRLAGDPLSRESTDAIIRLRQDYIPQAFDSEPVEVLVTGSTAQILDFNQTTDTYTPIVFAFVLGLSFLLLTLAFRSIVIPITSIIMNLLSVGAAYGLVVLVFQKGFGANLLGFQQVDAIESWLPLFLFSILFGLSMDYHVFLLSRIRERFNQTGDNHNAVAFGIRSTGRLITGAALIMVAVFGGFALGDMVMMQQMGFGLAIAVLMDATIVRCVLVPAVMRLLGKWNWYLPNWLAWLPKVGVGEASHEEVTQGGELSE